jgi:hypothetical protein
MVPSLSVAEEVLDPMLKTSVDGQVWLVTQPDHGKVAGYLASHWGNHDFRRPGHHGSASDPERLRAEIVFAIAQHDNGWWEWEAAPDLSPVDGLPLGLAEVLKDPQEGMNRWRQGLRRFASSPFANLLISRHAYWLYGARALPHPDPAFAHPLFWKGSPQRLYPGSLEGPAKFMAELEQLQGPWVDSLQSDPETAGWTELENILPSTRLLQICDGMSLALCSDLIPAKSGQTKGFGGDEFELHDVPRGGWNDRVTVRFTPRGQRRIEVSPYPFDIDPLPVVVPVTIVNPSDEKPAYFQSWWQASIPKAVEYQYISSV